MTRGREVVMTEGNAPVKYLVDGKWTDGPPSQSVSPEQGVVRPGSFRRRITRDGSSGFPIEPNRYHLYVSHACPFSQRATIVWTLTGLAEAIDVSIIDPRSVRWMGFRCVRHVDE
jgi:glutathionyl-hydroquinone reductase